MVRCVHILIGTDALGYAKSASSSCDLCSENFKPAPAISFLDNDR